MTARPWTHRLLDRLFPHDTLFVAGAPYMHRWYIAGYAPTPEDPDARMICATCRGDLTRGVQLDAGLFWHVTPPADDHPVQPVSAPREGWRWQDHGIGAVRLHCTVAGDDSRAFHDHPWPFLSVGLRGCYREVVPLGVEYDENGDPIWCPTPDDELGTTSRLYRAPFLNRKRERDLHVLDIERGPVWTLFFTRPKVRSWGFAGPFGFIPWREFDARFPERDAWTEQGK